MISSIISSIVCITITPVHIVLTTSWRCLRFLVFQIVCIDSPVHQQIFSPSYFRKRSENDHSRKLATYLNRFVLLLQQQSRAKLEITCSEGKLNVKFAHDIGNIACNTTKNPPRYSDVVKKNVKVSQYSRLQKEELKKLRCRLKNIKLLQKMQNYKMRGLNRNLNRLKLKLKKLKKILKMPTKCLKIQIMK